MWRINFSWETKTLSIFHFVPLYQYIDLLQSFRQLHSLSLSTKKKVPRTIWYPHWWNLRNRFWHCCSLEVSSSQSSENCNLFEQIYLKQWPYLRNCTSDPDACSRPLEQRKRNEVFRNGKYDPVNWEREKRGLQRLPQDSTSSRFVKKFPRANDSKLLSKH